MDRHGLDAYDSLLRDLPFVRAVAQAKDKLVVTTARGKFTLAPELVRSHLSRDNAERILSLAKTRPDLLVLAPYVGRDLGERFEEARVNFLDSLGNCYVQLGDDYLARVQSRTPQVAPTDKAMRAPAYRVLFALLADPTLLSATTRALAEASGGVSPQTARDVRARLEATGLLLSTQRAFRWAHGAQSRALEMWIAGYGSTLLPDLRIGRFRAREKDPHALEAQMERALAEFGQWSFGGGAAAERLTGYYRGEHTVVYLEKQVPKEALARSLQLVPDASGPVTIAVAPGPRAFGASNRTVHPLLVYADLLHEGVDRAREAAEEIRDRFLNFAEVRP